MAPLPVPQNWGWICSWKSELCTAIFLFLGLLIQTQHCFLCGASVICLVHKTYFVRQTSFHQTRPSTVTFASPVATRNTTCNYSTRYQFQWSSNNKVDISRQSKSTSSDDSTSYRYEKVADSSDEDEEDEKARMKKKKVNSFFLYSRSLHALEKEHRVRVLLYL